MDLMFTFGGIYLSGHFAKALKLLKYMQCVTIGVST